MKCSKMLKGPTVIALLVCMLLVLTGCNGAPTNSPAGTTTTDRAGKLGFSPDNPVKIVFDEWIGYWGAMAANGGLTTTPDSQNAKRGIYVEYQIMNVAADSSNALITGDVVGAGYTVNRYAFLHPKFEEAGCSAEQVSCRRAVQSFDAERNRQ